jgi:hypothetical protein
LESIDEVKRPLAMLRQEKGFSARSAGIILKTAAKKIEDGINDPQLGWTDQDVQGLKNEFNEAWDTVHGYLGDNLSANVSKI